MNTQLMTHVERAVRPLPAYPVRKMQMRNDLYGLLSDIYDEELQRNSNEETAASAAIERFGPAAALCAELRESLSWADRLAYLEDWLFRSRTGEGAVRHATRVCGFIFLYVGALMLPLLLAFRISGGVPDGERVAVALVLAFGSFAFLATLLVHASAWCMTRSRWNAKSVGVLALSILSAGVVTLLIGFGVHWIGALDPHDALRGLRWWAPTAIGGMIAVPVLAALVVRRDRREEPWSSLILD